MLTLTELTDDLGHKTVIITEAGRDTMPMGERQLKLSSFKLHLRAHVNLLVKTHYQQDIL